MLSKLFDNCLLLVIIITIKLKLYIMNVIVFLYMIANHQSQNHLFKIKIKLIKIKYLLKFLYMLKNFKIFIKCQISQRIIKFPCNPRMI